MSVEPSSGFHPLLVVVTMTSPSVARVLKKDGSFCSGAITVNNRKEKDFDSREDAKRHPPSTQRQALSSAHSLSRLQ
jgi:hypothetical protein